jgi:capsular polysaccharide biosynthesis protein
VKKQPGGGHQQLHSRRHGTSDLGMTAKAELISLIRTIDPSNITTAVETLERGLAGSLPSEHKASTIRHLAALGFRLEGTEQYRSAAQIYDLAARFDPRSPTRWESHAAEARLRDLIVRQAWGDARAFVVDLRQSPALDAIGPCCVAILLDHAWHFECRYVAEPSVWCYRLAFELNGGDTGITTPDGHPLSVKIKNIRRIQLTDLAEAGRYEEAAALHDETRSITGHCRVGIYDIVSVRQATDSASSAYDELLPARPIDDPAVTFLDGPVAVTSHRGILTAPPQYIARLRDCLTFPRSNLVLHRDRLVYDLAAHPLSYLADIKDGVNPGQIMMAVYGPERALVETPTECRTIDAGLMLFGFQSRQYGHWLLEFVPRILWFNNPACPPDLPVCIDDGMPDTHRQILALMDERNRPVITLAAEPVRFGELGIAPVPTFYPFDTRAGYAVYDAVWPRDILAAVRQRVFTSLARAGLELRPTGKRIFLSRRGFTQRQLLNEDEIIQTLAREGFQVVQPEHLSFAEQVQLYQTAEFIVGSASSALINCMFCNSQAKIVALVHENTSFYFSGFTSIVESSGAKLLFIRGQTAADIDGHPMHANYTVSPKRVLASLQAFKSID